jgi:hypothetical protein
LPHPPPFHLPNAAWDGENSRFIKM